MNSRKTKLVHMDMAWKIADTSNCRRKKVGVVIVRGKIILVSSANGTSAGITPCNEGGCPRCLSDTPSGELYDSCLCIHAEQLAIAQAARSGIRLDGATLFSTLRPCLICAKLCLETGITRIIYNEEIPFSDAVEESYEKFLKQVKLKCIRSL